MPWFLIWTLLVIASLVLGFFLLRDLWRKAQAFMAEFARASEVLEQLTQRTAELTATLEQVQEAHEAQKADFTDLAAAQRRVKAMRKARQRKKAGRRQNHAAKRRTWRDIAVDPRFDRWRKK